MRLLSYGFGFLTCIHLRSYYTPPHIHLPTTFANPIVDAGVCTGSAPSGQGQAPAVQGTRRDEGGACHQREGQAGRLLHSPTGYHRALTATLCPHSLPRGPFPLCNLCSMGLGQAAVLVVVALVFEATPPPGPDPCTFVLFAWERGPQRCAIRGIQRGREEASGANA